MTRHVLRFLSLVYRYVLRPLVPGGAGGRTCRYEPTCSRYASDAVLQRGWVRGSGLAIWRVLRCNPWSDGGYDPVPGPRSADVPSSDGSASARRPSSTPIRDDA